LGGHGCHAAIRFDRRHIEESDKTEAPFRGDRPAGAVEETSHVHSRTACEKAAEYAELLKHTDSPSEIHNLNRLKESFTHLAQNEDWLAHNFDKIIHSQGIVPQLDADEKLVGQDGGRDDEATASSASGHQQT
jgi:hypothetical protein